MKATLLFLALVLAQPTAAQRLSFRGDEVAAGAVSNVLLRGPWMAPGWRRPLPRLLLFNLASVGYELYLDKSGWEWADVRPRLEGYLLVDGFVALVRRKW